MSVSLEYAVVERERRFLLRLDVVADISADERWTGAAVAANGLPGQSS